MTDSMIFHRLSDNVKTIENEVVRKAVKAILAETDADMSSPSRKGTMMAILFLSALLMAVSFILP